MQLLEKHPSEGPREVCRAVILIVRRSALVKVDSPRAIDQCIHFFGESKERHAPCVTPLGKGRPGGALAGVHPAALVAHPLAALVERTSIDPQVIDDVIAGCVSQIGEQSTKIARRAVLAAGRRDHAVVHRRSLQSRSTRSRARTFLSAAAWLNAPGLRAQRLRTRTVHERSSEKC